MNEVHSCRNDLNKIVYGCGGTKNVFYSVIVPPLVYPKETKKICTFKDIQLFIMVEVSNERLERNVIRILGSPVANDSNVLSELQYWVQKLSLPSSLLSPQLSLDGR